MTLLLTVGLLLAVPESDDSARLAYIQSLSSSPSEQNYAALQQAMNDDLNDEVRQAAAEGLLHYDGTTPLLALEKFLRAEPGEHVRKSICDSLSEASLHAGNPQATALLAERLRHDPSPKVRLSAAAALEARKDRRALKDLLLAMQGDADAKVRRRARRAHAILSKIPPPSVKMDEDEPAQSEPHEPQKGRDSCGGIQGWCECALAIPPTTLPARCLALEQCQSRYDDFLRRNGYRCLWDGRPLE